MPLVIDHEHWNLHILQNIIIENGCLATIQSSKILKNSWN